MEVAGGHHREIAATRSSATSSTTPARSARRAAPRRRWPTSSSTPRSAGKVAIVATELANNLLRHAGGGELLLQTLGDDESPVVELLAIDRGPGMADVARCLADGYSTGGTPGTGLGAVRRLATEFDIYSAPGEGTIVMARFGAAAPRCATARSTSRSRARSSAAMPGAWRTDADGIARCSWSTASAMARSRPRPRDVGVDAFAADAVRARRRTSWCARTALMSKTRGGAGACARIVGDKRFVCRRRQHLRRRWSRAGKSQGLVSHNGTLGLQSAAHPAVRIPARAGRAAGHALRRRLGALGSQAQSRRPARAPSRRSSRPRCTAITAAGATTRRSWWWPA